MQWEPRGSVGRSPGFRRSKPSTVIGSGSCSGLPAQRRSFQRARLRQQEPGVLFVPRIRCRARQVSEQPRGLSIEGHLRIGRTAEARFPLGTDELSLPRVEQLRLDELNPPPAAPTPATTNVASRPSSMARFFMSPPCFLSRYCPANWGATQVPIRPSTCRDVGRVEACAPRTSYPLLATCRHPPPPVCGPRGDSGPLIRMAISGTRWVGSNRPVPMPRPATGAGASW